MVTVVWTEQSYSVAVQKERWVISERLLTIRIICSSQQDQQWRQRIRQIPEIHHPLLILLVILGKDVFIVKRNIKESLSYQGRGEKLFFKILINITQQSISYTSNQIYPVEKTSWT